MDGYDVPPYSGQGQPEIQPDGGSFIERHGISPVLFAFLSLVVIFFLYQIVGGIMTALVFGLKPTPEKANGFRIATGVGQFLFILLPTMMLARFASPVPKNYLRIRTPDVRTLLVPLVGIFSLQQLLQVYLFFQEKIPVPQSIEQQVNQFKELLEEAYRMLVGAHSIPELLAVILIVALIPAIAEELMFRGLVQRSFEKGLSPGKGVLVTGVIFGAYHLNPFSIVPLVLLGIYLGFLVLRANNIWVSVSAHFYNNTIACIAAYVNKDDALITGDPGEMSFGFLAASFVFFAFLFALSTYYFIVITKQANSSGQTAGVIA